MLGKFSTNVYDLASLSWKQPLKWFLYFLVTLSTVT